MAALRSKYTRRTEEIPAYVPKGQAVDDLRGLRESLLGLEPGKAPGAGGMRPEFLICLAEVFNNEEMDLLQDFGMLYLNGELPAWFYKVWLSVTTAALFKTALQDTIRPIGIRNPLLRTFHRFPVRQNREALVRYLEPEQLSMSEAGGAKLVHQVRMLSGTVRDWT